MNEKELIEKIVYIRKQKKLTQGMVASVSGLTQQQISLIETMERSPSITTMLKYCKAIGISLDVVEDRSEENNE